MRALTPYFLSLSLAVTAWPSGGSLLRPRERRPSAFREGCRGGDRSGGCPPEGLLHGYREEGGPGHPEDGKLPPTTAKDELGDGIWHGSVRVPMSGEGLSGTVTLQVTYQPCTEGEGGVCYPPTTRSLEVKASEIPVAVPAAKLRFCR